MPLVRRRKRRRSGFIVYVNLRRVRGRPTAAKTLTFEPGSNEWDRKLATRNANYYIYSPALNSGKIFPTLKNTGGYVKYDKNSAQYVGKKIK